MIPRGLLFNGAHRFLAQTTPCRYLNINSQRPRRQGKHYRLWAMPGDEILERDILARQWTMFWHPGLNAGIDENRNIYAMCDGVMIITEEPYEPDWEHPIVSKAYIKRETKLAPNWQRYIHVIPKKPVSEFKLIDEI